MVRLFSLPFFALGLALASVAWSGDASAQNKAGKARPAKVIKAKPLPKKAAKPEPEPEKEKDSVPAAADAKPSPEAEPKLRPAGTSQAEPAASKASSKDVKEKEGPEGVKTYQFGEIEVEGRQKSPQLIYFLRRVRAEFDAGALGHRSFLGELKDTRNDTAFR